MSNEINSGIRARAARHAALADPTRLRIVDLLTLGDFSPVELQAELGMPSNLLSHHLRVLEEAGLVARHRSEADRRRSYVRLASTAFDGMTPGMERAARSVLFVCTRNSARSQLAAALWRQVSDIPTASAGTHPAERIARGAIEAARRHGLELGDLPPRRLDQVALDPGLLVTVCDNAHEELAGRGDVHWSVPDPLRLSTDEAFEEAFEDLAGRVSALAPRLLAA